MELPIDFKNKMVSLLRNQADDFFDSLNLPSQKAITVNFSKMPKSKFESIADFNIQPIEKVDNGYYVENLKIGSHILNHLGVIYSQEPSAMYPVEMLDIKENDLVLDLCAAPGGKSIQILEKLNGTGLLVSNELVYNRAKILYENLNRIGFKNSAITCNNPKDFESLNIKFDKILIDAPCGGEGMFRKDNFDFKAYTQINIETNAKRQLNILESAKKILKDGGRIVYSTCTYDTKENEEVVATFIKNNPEFKIIKINGFDNVTSTGVKIDNANTNDTYRRYPHLHKGEGQYMAVLEKHGDDNFEHFDKFCNSAYSPISNKDSLLLQSTFKNVADISKLNIVKKNDTFFALPQKNINFNNLNLLSVGCVIGSVNKNIFKINHNFYHIYGDLFYNKLELELNELNKYLKGEEVDITTQNGIYVITYNKVYLGGGKVVGCRLKNYYPKELRNNN